MSPASPALSATTRRPAAIALAAIAAVAFLPLAPSSSAAQSWRTVESSRQLRDSAPVAVHVGYGAGRLDVRPTWDPVMYRMELRYDAERDTPIHEYDAGAHRVYVGARTSTSSVIRNDRGREMRLDLPRNVPLDLSLDLGAVQGELDLRGVAVQRLDLQTGASDMRVRFDSSAGRPIERIEAEAGAAHLSLVDIASAAPGSVWVHVGIGGADLDFGRTWRNDIDLEAQAALGSLTLHLPREVGIRLELDRTLSGFDQTGMQRRDGNTWVSDNWETATRRLRVRAETALGKLRIDRY